MARECDDCMVAEFVKVAREVLEHADTLCAAGLHRLVDRARRVMTEKENGAGG